MSIAPKSEQNRRLPKGMASIDELDAFDEIIDVRSPSEFADDHIPGARSHPVLDDAQRAEVGTIYKQVSPFDAKKLGAAYVSRNIAAHIEADFIARPKTWRPLIVCWRGGQRSGAMTTVLRSIGWDARQLEGGYKAFRHRVLRELEEMPAGLRLHIISGPTGSAKTRIIQAIAGGGGQTIDLEDIACHKGSVLGRLPERPQPSQKWFETQIWQQLRLLNPEKPVFVEAESRKIGNLRLPEMLFNAMKTGAVHEIEASVEHRVDFLLRGYDYFTADRSKLIAPLDGLRPILGHEVVNRWHSLIAAGEFRTLTRTLLAEHYDPQYERALERNYAGNTRHRVAAASLDDTEITRIAQQLLETTTSPQP